jgi:hypothetical protein
MSIQKVISENEFKNKLYKYKKLRKEYEQDLPNKHKEELTSKKGELISIINDLRICDCYDTIPSDSDKSDIELLYNKLI